LTLLKGYKASWWPSLAAQVLGTKNAENSATFQWIGLILKAGMLALLPTGRMREQFIS